ncbi:hypothetical protein GDO86_004488 [Hymenochirus boettgeri]|uniref:Uncharacterized protein n=1 Tax=Hymenochirus boettgeri TaxID=247094 RepID=A0A8T2K8Y9_9PIPI|nr:hypothetical protein GDO86_004488 [Hymenochirus boettgeri]
MDQPGVGSMLELRRLRDPLRKIYICNHRTTFDHNVISLITACSSPSVSCLPGFLCWARGFMELGAPGSRTQMMESLKHYLSQSGAIPLLLFPEEETTNGRIGLLHFRWLPSVSRNLKESDEDFACRVQQVMALSLGIVGTRHTAADIAEHLKRKSRDPPSPAPKQPLTPTHIQMAERVKDVLPQVPLSAIYKDLGEYDLMSSDIPYCNKPRGSFLTGQVTSPAVPSSLAK